MRRPFNLAIAVASLAASGLTLAAPDNKMQADDGKAAGSTKYIAPYKGATVDAPPPKPARVQDGQAPKGISVDKYGNIIEQRPPSRTNRSTGGTVQ